MQKDAWIKGWKVIRNDRMSCTADIRTLPILYLKNKETSRHNNQQVFGPLAVFKTRKYAREFKDEYGGRFCTQHWKSTYWKVVRCEFKKSKAMALWENPCHRQCRLPKGTVLAEKVKCLE